MAAIEGMIAEPGVEASAGGEDRMACGGQHCGWGLTFRSFLCRDVERLLYVEATRSGCSPNGGVTCVAGGRISTTSPPAAHPRQTRAGDDSLAPALVLPSAKELGRQRTVCTPLTAQPALATDAAGAATGA